MSCFCTRCFRWRYICRANPHQKQWKQKTAAFQAKRVDRRKERTSLSTEVIIDISSLRGLFKTEDECKKNKLHTSYLQGAGIFSEHREELTSNL